MSLADPYAKALFEKEASEKIDSLLEGCARLMKESPLFIPFFDHPEVSLDAKEKMLQEIFQNSTIVRFFLLLLVNHRFQQLPEISLKYHQLLLQKEGEVEIQVVSAIPLSRSIEKQLQMRFQKKCRLKMRVDPDILGGLILIVGNDILDYSLKGRLEGLKRACC